MNLNSEYVFILRVFIAKMLALIINHSKLLGVLLFDPRENTKNK